MLKGKGRSMKKSVVISVFVILLFLILSCEPISVSVNSKSEIAFARSEGVFFYSLKDNSLTTVLLNQSTELVPVITRWSYDDKKIAFTIKKSISSNNTDLFVVDLKNNVPKKVFSIAQPITQVEWSPNGKYISVAHAGADSDMSVADISLIWTENGTSKLILSNTGDVHSWIDGETFVYMKVVEKNTEKSDLFRGELTSYIVATESSDFLCKTIISKTGSIDVNRKTHEVSFISLAGSSGEIEYKDEMSSTLTFPFIFNINTRVVDRFGESMANFVKYSPDYKKLLMRVYREGDYELVVSDMDNTTVIISKALNTVKSGNSEVQAYPNWLDNNTVLYFDSVRTWGSGGDTVRLMALDLNTQVKYNLQIEVENKIHRMIFDGKGY